MTLPHLRQYLELGGAAGVDLHRAELRRRLHDHSGGLGTANLPYIIYQIFYNAHDYGRASAAGVVVVIGTIIIATFALRTVSSLFREESLMTTHRGTPGASRPRAADGATDTRRRLSDCDRRAWSAWIIGMLFVAPVLWMVLTSLHSEPDAATNPPTFFAPLTLDGYSDFFAATGASPWPPLINSATAAIVSTILVLLLAIPAAYALSIRPVRKWTDVMFFFLSTKMLPVVAGLLPVYLIAQNIGLLDNIYLLVILYTSMNLPIAVWMMRSFLAEVPVEMLEAASLDGAGLMRTLRLDHRTGRAARHRGHVADLLHLQLERAAVRPGAHRRRSRRPPRCSSPASSPARACSWPRCARHPSWCRSR